MLPTPSAYIIDGSDEPMVRYLRDEASDYDVACAALMAASALEESTRWVSARGVPNGYSLDNLPIDDMSSALGDRAFEGWLQRDGRWFWPEILAIAVERGVVDRMGGFGRDRQSWMRARVSGALRSLSAFVAAAPDGAIRVVDARSFSPAYCRALPEPQRSLYAARFVEAALEPVLDLAEVEAALDAGEVSAKLPQRAVVRALMGEEVRTQECVPLMLRGQTKKARTTGSKEWKAWKGEPRASLGFLVLAGFIDNNNLAYRRQWSAHFGGSEGLHGIDALIASDAKNRGEAERRMALFREHYEYLDDSRLFISSVIDIVCAAWFDPSVGALPMVPELARRAKARNAPGLEALLRQVIQLSNSEPTSVYAGIADIVGQRVVKPAWQLAAESLKAALGEHPVRHQWHIYEIMDMSTCYSIELLRSSPTNPEHFEPVDKHFGLLGRDEALTTNEHIAIRLLNDSHHYTLVPADLPGFVSLLEEGSVFFEGAPLRVIDQQVVVHEADDGSVQVTVEPQERSDEPLRSEDGWYCVRRNPKLTRVAEALGASLDVPAEGRATILAQLEALVRRDVPVISELPELTTVRRVWADPTPVLRLTPEREALFAEVGVCPGGAGTAFVHPGRGTREALRRDEDGAFYLERDLVTEERLAQPFFEVLGGSHDVLEGVELLEFLAQVRDAAEAGEARVEWPKGVPLKLPRRVESGAFAFSSSQNGAWFELSGEARYDDGLVVRFIELLASQEGRFVTLDDGTVIELSESLAEDVERARRLGEVEQGTMRFNAAVAVDSDAEFLPLGEDFHAHRKQLERALKATPRVPKSFNGELMPYQHDGYRWLARLTDAGLGACLADDMGLGKTVQALALLLRRAKQGPALVVAPTSVCANWRSEAERFAPSLRVIDARDDRDALESASAGELVVVSYGLLRNEVERATRQTWATVVLDEAQAIKNPEANQSQAAFALPAKVRIACTGTPIENRLEELWSLFHFLMPGYLGTRKSFVANVAGPIEAGDASARERLQRRVLPFILRRTKSEVLRDLPSKTERVQWLDWSEEEAAFYEARRRLAQRAVEGLSDGPQNRIRILAEITRLRQACCSPALLEPELEGSSTKIEALRDALDDVLGGGGAAIVFSQFVSFLDLIEEDLASQGIRYRRLDGSTPAKRRAQDVAAFQAGEFDVFLISLKAGGTGLNLTRASYVFIMDPWWNPAVEDQAADRAHRYGQQLPVTITRFVVPGTIEAKILNLHESKRELADAVLGAEASSTRLDFDQLVGLVGEEA